MSRSQRTAFIVGGQAHLPSGHLVNRVAVGHAEQQIDSPARSRLDAVYAGVAPLPHLKQWALAAPLAAPIRTKPERIVDVVKRKLGRLRGVVELEGGVFEDGAAGRPGHGALAETACRELLQDAQEEAAIVLGMSADPVHNVLLSSPAPAPAAPPVGGHGEDDEEQEEEEEEEGGGRQDEVQDQQQVVRDPGWLDVICNKIPGAWDAADPAAVFYIVGAGGGVFGPMTGCEFEAACGRGKSKNWKSEPPNTQLSARPACFTRAARSLPPRRRPDPRQPPCSWWRPRDRR